MCSGHKPSHKLEGAMVRVGTNDQDGNAGEKVLKAEASGDFRAQLEGLGVF